MKKATAVGGRLWGYHLPIQGEMGQMKIAFEVDARLILVTTACGVVGLFALHGAFPGLYDYWPKTSADLASWVQAVGSIAAILASARIASAQIRHSREIERGRYLRKFRSYEGFISSAASFVETTVANLYTAGDSEWFLTEEYSDRERLDLLAALEEIQFGALESSEGAMALLSLKNCLVDLARLVRTVGALTDVQWDADNANPERFMYQDELSCRAQKSKDILLKTIQIAASEA